MNNTSKVIASFLAVGDKGYHAVEDSIPACTFGHIVTYGQPSSTKGPHAFDELGDRCGARVLHTSQPPADVFEQSDIVFAIGWQYLIVDPPDNLVVVHDSLLPAYRGFAPTVAALLDGALKIGVSSIIPADGVDDGDVLAQSSTSIRHPITIAQALRRLRPCYRDVIAKTLDGFVTAERSLVGQRQRHDQATYSQWRDDSDYFIDFGSSADEVVRHVLAVGRPYPGARAMTVRGEKLVVQSAERVADRSIVRRAPGKVWSLGGETVDVVCGSGIVRLGGIVSESGEAYTIRLLRTRFISAEMAEHRWRTEASKEPLS